MLFYGKEIDIFYIILLVIFILVVYILISYYMQQKQSIALTTSSQPIIDTTSTTTIPLYLKKEPEETLKRGAFAISLWLNIDSWVPPPPKNDDANFNILTMNNTTITTTQNQIFRLYIDSTCNLSINSTFFTNNLNKKIDVYRITGNGDNDGNNVNIGAGNNIFTVSGTNFNNGKPLTYTIPSGSYNATTFANVVQNVMNSAGTWTKKKTSPEFYINIISNVYSIGFKINHSDKSTQEALQMTFVGRLESGVPFDSKRIFGSIHDYIYIYESSPPTPKPTTLTAVPNFYETTSVLPIKEPVNVILNYNGDDDYNEDKNQFFTAKDGTTKIPIYNNDTGFAYSNRALDVFINGRLNNTIILNTSLTRNDKGTPNCNASCVSYNDASMNYLIHDNIQFLIGSSVGPVPITGPVGTISNVTFIKDGCSVQDAQSIYESGNSSNILDNLFSYKLQFSLLEDDKKVKTVEFL